MAERISVHSLPDLKNTTDDAIPSYLNSLPFTQSHTLTDTRLALGYTAFIISALTFYWDYTFGFENTKLYTAIAVLAYTILNTILSIWVWGVEKNIIYTGHSTLDGSKIIVESKTEKFKPIYHLTITFISKNGKDKKITKLMKHFNEWFDLKGGFVVEPFQQMLATGVEVLGKLDPKHVVKKEKKIVQQEDGRENLSMDDKWASLLAESSGVSLDQVAGLSSSPAAPATGGKKRKGKKVAA